MSLLTISKKKKKKLKAGEGVSSRFYIMSRIFYRFSFLFLLFSLLFILSGCGIPTPLYLAPPERITTGVGFRHAKTNDPNIFLGYEIFYLFYDENSPPVSENTATDWESYAESWLNPAVLSNPNSDIMSYSKKGDPRFRRVYAGPADSFIGVSVVMFPIDPNTVDFSGGDSINFFLVRQTQVPYDTLMFTSSVPEVLSFPDDNPGALDYKESELPARRVILRGGVSRIVDFFDIDIDNDDDLSTSFSEADPLSVAFFAVTTGYDLGTRIVSDVVFIGSHTIF